MKLFLSHVVLIFSFPCILTDDGSALLKIAGGPLVPSPGSTVAAAETPASAEVPEPWKINQRMSLMMYYSQNYTATYSKTQLRIASLVKRSPLSAI